MIILEKFDSNFKIFDARIGKTLSCKVCDEKGMLTVYDMKHGGPYCSFGCLLKGEVYLTKEFPIYLKV